MSLTLLFSKRRGGKIDDLQLDATITEVHDYENEVTQFPVEDGSSINDHIRKMPAKLQMEGFITNSPINSIQTRIAETVKSVGGLFTSKNLNNDDVKNNVDFAFQALLALTGRQIDGFDTTPKLLTVVTGLRVYKNMAINSLRVPRDISTGQALRFTCMLVEVKKVKTESVDIPNAKAADKDLAQSKVAKGKQTPAAPKDAVRSKSMLYNIAFGN